MITYFICYLTISSYFNLLFFVLSFIIMFFSIQFLWWMEVQPMESGASSHSSSRGWSTSTVPLTDGGMDGCGAPQPMTMTRRRSGVSVRVSLPLNTVAIIRQTLAQSKCEKHITTFSVLLWSKHAAIRQPQIGGYLLVWLDEHFQVWLAHFPHKANNKD